MTTDSAYDQHIFWCVRAKRRVAGWVGLLGVAGIMKLIVSQWIIPENSLRLAQVRHSAWENDG